MPDLLHKLLEPLTVASGLLSVALGVRQNVWCWPVGIVNLALSLALFYRQGFYSDTGLQLVYFVLSLYGWYQWRRGGANRGILPVSRTNPRAWVGLTVTGVVGWLILGMLTRMMPGVSLPYTDAALASISILAQWMLTKKLLENWTLWMAVNAGYVSVFIYKSLYLLAFNYALYFILAVRGYLAWKRSLAIHSIGGGAGAGGNAT